MLLTLDQFFFRSVAQLFSGTAKLHQGLFALTHASFLHQPAQVVQVFGGKKPTLRGCKIGMINVLVYKVNCAGCKIGPCLLPSKH